MWAKKKGFTKNVYYFQEINISIKFLTYFIIGVYNKFMSVDGVSQKERSYYTANLTFFRKHEKRYEKLFLVKYKYFVIKT